MINHKSVVRANEYMVIKMKFSNNTKGFGIISIFLHWCFAIAIIGLLGSGLYMVTLTYYDAWYHPLPYYHKLFGIGTFFFFIIRTLWHFMHVQPKMNSDKKWEVIAAKLTHKLMLLLSGGILVTGYLIISVDVTEIEWLGMSLPSINLNLENQADLAGFWHEYLAYGLIALLLLHAGATFKHQFIDKDKLLQKIIKPRSV